MNLNSLLSAALEFQVESRLKLTIAQVATTTTTATYAVKLQQQQQLEWSHCRLTVSAPSSIRQQGPQQRDQPRSVDLDQISLAVSLSLPLTAPSPSPPPLSLSLHIAIAVFFFEGGFAQWTRPFYAIPQLSLSLLPLSMVPTWNGLFALYINYAISVYLSQFRNVARLFGEVSGLISCSWPSCAAKLVSDFAFIYGTICVCAKCPRAWPSFCRVASGVTGWGKLKFKYIEMILLWNTLSIELHWHKLH